MFRVPQLRFVAMCILTFALSTTCLAQTFTSGDVLAAVGNGQVNWYKPDGTLVKVLNTNGGGFTTGMAFDKAGNLYVTGFSTGTVYKFDSTGTLLGTFAKGFVNCESIVFDNAGNVYVGDAARNVITKLDATGIVLATFTVATEDRGTDWLDLAQDQHTLHYTSEGSSVLSYDTAANTQNAAFSTLLPGAAAFAHRILANGDELVADSSVALRLSGLNGSIAQTYPVPGNAGGLFGLNLDPDGVHFWTSDFANGQIFQVRIDTGVIDRTIATGSGSLFGVAVFGEQTAAVVNTAPFAKFTAEVDVDRLRNQFEVEGSFTLGATSNGINPRTEDVTLTVEGFTLTIPKSSFKLNTLGSFVFEGLVKGRHVEALIKPLGSNAFHFEIEVSAPDPTAGHNPASVQLTIGDDTGKANAYVEFQTR
jgi:streptogramin lyase